MEEINFDEPQPMDASSQSIDVYDDVVTEILAANRIGREVKRWVRCMTYIHAHPYLRK